MRGCKSQLHVAGCACKSSTKFGDQPMRPDMRSNARFTPILPVLFLLQGRGETKLPKGPHFQISAWTARRWVASCTFRSNRELSQGWDRRLISSCVR